MYIIFLIYTIIEVGIITQDIGIIIEKTDLLNIIAPTGTGIIDKPLARINIRNTATRNAIIDNKGTSPLVRITRGQTKEAEETEMSLQKGEKIISKRKTNVLVLTEANEENKFYEESIKRRVKGKVLTDTELYVFNSANPNKPPMIFGDILLENGLLAKTITAKDWKVLK